jgi:hypothetical protein
MDHQGATTQARPDSEHQQERMKEVDIYENQAATTKARPAGGEHEQGQLSADRPRR